MTSPSSENIPTEAHLALAHSRPDHRERLRLFFELDSRLARIVAATTEPMLGQMRLAWWRDTLGQPVDQRPSGDAVLDGISQNWRGAEANLVRLVDGWEHLLAEPPLPESEARSFLDGRCDALLAVYAEAGEMHRAAAWHWCCADLAAKVSLDEERALFLRLAAEKDAAVAALPRNARSLAVLGALGRRALERGGRPLMEGRSASLTALRASFIGR